MKAKYFGWEFRAAVEAAAHKVAANLNQGRVARGLRVKSPIRIVWSAAVSTAGIDRDGQVYLCDVADDAVLDIKHLNKYIGYVVHELLHREYTDFSVGNNSGKYLRVLHNAVEDIWIERKGIEATLTGNIKGLLTDLLAVMVDQAMDEVTDWSDPRQYPFALAVYGRNYAHNVPLAKGLEPIFREASKRIDICVSSQDTLMVAQWVYDRLKHLNDDQGKGQGQEQGKGKEQGKGEGQEPGKGEGEGQGQEPGQGEGQGDGSGKAAKGSTGDDQGQGKGKVAGNDKKAGKARSPVHKNGRTFEPREVEPTVSAPAGAEGAGGTFDRKSGMRKEAFHASSAGSVWTIQAGVAGKLRYEVRRLFENSGLDEFQPHRKTGSLDSKSLTKVATGSSRLFKRRMEVEGIDSAVVIVLDTSGSMAEQGNVKIAAAVQTCAALLETLAAAGVATAVLTFDNYTSVLKPFNTHFKKTMPLLQRIRCNGSTNDYFAIKIAHEMLLNRSEARKVVFVLTDGDGNVAQAKAQVASGVKLGLTTIGVGMMHNVKLAV